MPFTLANLKDELRPLIFPNREAPNLRDAHDKMFVEALVDMQRMVPCLEYNNSNVFPQCSTYFQCGMTVFDAPRGSIKRLWTVDRINPTTHVEDINSAIEWCSRVDYKQVHKCDIEQYVSAVGSGCGNCGSALSSVFGWPLGLCGLKTFPTPTDAGWLHLPALPMGLHYPQSSTDSQCRARRGVWAIERGRIYVAPWIQSTETIIVEWDGIKRDWDDSDILENNPTLKRAVRYFVAAGQAKDYDHDDAAYIGFRRDYEEAVRQLWQDCRDETRVRGCEDSLARQSTAYAEFTAATGGTSNLPDGTVTTTQNQSTCGEIAPVEFFPPSGAIVTFPSWVVLTSDASEAEIYFTIDGSTPDRDSLLYSGPFQTVAGVNIKAIAFLGGCPSEIRVSNWLDASNYSEIPPTLSVLCTDTDRCGQWFMFGPDGSPDINWQLIFALFPGAIIERLEMYETDTDGIWTSGRSWATQFEILPVELDGDPFRSFPLVLDEGSQLNTEYTENLNFPASGIHFWEMFGESVGVTSTGKFYKLIITLVDGTKFYCTHKIACDGDCIAIDGSGPIITVLVGDDSTSNLTLTFLCASGGWMLSNYTTDNGDADTVTFLPSSIQLGQTVAPSTDFTLVVTVNGILIAQCYTTPPICSDPPPPPPTTTSTTTSTSSTSTVALCDDGHSLALGVDIELEVLSWSSPGSDPADCVCVGESIVQECSPGSFKCIKSEIINVTELTRALCSEVFSFSDLYFFCAEFGISTDPPGTSPYEVSITFNPLTNLYSVTVGDGSVTDVGPGTYNISPLPCDDPGAAGYMTILTIG